MMIRGVYYNIHIVLIVTLFLRSIESHPPHRWSKNQTSMKYEIPSPETDRLNRDELQLPAPRVREVPSVVAKARMKSTVLNIRQTTEMDSQIIFPPDVPYNTPQSYSPAAAAVCKNTTYCEYPPYYPQNFIETAIKTRVDLKFLATVDTPPEIGQRIDADNDDPLCAYQESVVFPKSAENKNKEWLYVVNEESFPQGVRIETCMTQNTGCSIIDGFAEGYKTSCKQKFIYRQLAAVSSNGSVGPDLFRFPASCCCHVKFIGNPLTRIGAGADKANPQSPAPRAIDSRVDESGGSESKTK